MDNNFSIGNRIRELRRNYNGVSGADRKKWKESDGCSGRKVMWGIRNRTFRFFLAKGNATKRTGLIDNADCISGEKWKWRSETNYTSDDKTGIEIKERKVKGYAFIEKNGCIAFLNK